MPWLCRAASLLSRYTYEGFYFAQHCENQVLSETAVVADHRAALGYINQEATAMSSSYANHEARAMEQAGVMHEKIIGYRDSATRGQVIPAASRRRLPGDRAEIKR